LVPGETSIRFFSEQNQRWQTNACFRHQKIPQRDAKPSVEERMHCYQFREDRADVIVPALQIFNNVMTWAEIKHIYVPKISVADGLVKSIYYNLKKKKSI
jgi:exopolyphosphatase/pppGpp-phosphohydrolase